MLKCIGSKCFYHFTSDVYCKCSLCEKYVLPGTECLGIEYIKDRMLKLDTDLMLLQQKVKCCKNELDILKHLQNHINKNQHLI